jgi:hypothetical protein
MAISKACVCIHVTSGLDQIELALLSDDRTHVQQAVSVSCALYDGVSRRLSKPEEIAPLIKQLYALAKLPLGLHPTVLVLPSYFSQTVELTANLSPDDIEMVLLGEVEQHYIFKNQEPVLDWVPINSSHVFYSAYIKEDIDIWTQALQDLNIKLVTLDTGFFAAFRGLMGTGALQSVIEHDRPWMLVNLTDYSCQIGSFKGTRLTHAEEIPLGTEDIALAVQDIVQDVHRILEQCQAEQLTLLNNTLRINTNTLKATLNVDIPTIDIVQNKHTVQALGAAQGQVLYPCSLEALGGVLTRQFATVPQLNFAPKDAVHSMESDGAKGNVFRGLAIANIAAMVLCALTWVILQGIIWSQTAEVQKVAPANSLGPSGPMARIGNATALQKLNTPNLYIKLLAKTIYERNLWANNVIVFMGSQLPETLWMETLTLDHIPNASKTQVTITGKSTNAAPLDALQTALTKQFAEQAPKLEQVEPDPTQANLYRWTVGLNNTATTAANTVAAAPATPALPAVPAVPVTPPTPTGGHP